MTRGETGRLMAETGIVPRRSRGQNFLTDGRVADRHIGYAGIAPGDRVLEVGPGLGVLTKRILAADADLTCIELDGALADYIESEYGGRLTLVRGDAVKVPFPEFDLFISNLPYSVSTPVIFKLLGYDFRKAVVMVQKEFGERMTADVGSPDYSRLTVNLFYRADCEILENVPASAFKPRPRVDSCLVSITPRPAPFSVRDEAVFFKVVEACFGMRRKKIATALRNAHLIGGPDGIPYADERIEHLRPAEIAEVADAVYAERAAAAGRRRQGWSARRRNGPEVSCGVPVRLRSRIIVVHIAGGPGAASCAPCCENGTRDVVPDAENGTGHRGQFQRWERCVRQ